MKSYRVTVDGQAFEVTVEERRGTDVPPPRIAPPPVPAPSALPRPAAQAEIRTQTGLKLAIPPHCGTQFLLCPWQEDYPRDLYMGCIRVRVWEAIPQSFHPTNKDPFAGASSLNRRYCLRTPDMRPRLRQFAGDDRV